MVGRHLAVGLLVGRLSGTARANMLDLVQPLKLRPNLCTFGCARWSALAADGSTANQTAVDAAWAAGAAPAGAAATCAQQGRSLGATPSENYTDGWNHSSPWTADGSLPGYSGAFCYCANTTATTEGSLWGYCQSPPLTPEQLNLQVAGPNSVVVAFVTFGDANPEHGNAPVAQFWPSNGASGPPPRTPPATATAAIGVTTVYDTDAAPYDEAGKEPWWGVGVGTNWSFPERRYFMHFVRLDGLVPGKTYHYRVRSDHGKDYSMWSTIRSFRFGTMRKFAMFGDM